MKRILGTAMVVVGMMAVPAVAFAQMQHSMGAPKHEFGVDLVFGYSKADVTGADASIIVATPVDVRVGFVSSGNLMFEPRFAFQFDSKAGFDTTSGKATSAFAFSPGVNILYRLGAGHGMHNQMGNYVTVGAAYDMLDFGSLSFNQPVINGGIGMRRAYGGGAIRTEAFVAYALKSGNETDIDFVPAHLTIGLRLGLSLWH